MIKRKNIVPLVLGSAIFLTWSLFAFTRARGVLHLAELRDYEASDIAVVRISRGNLAPGSLAPITNATEIERLLNGLRGAVRASRNQLPISTILRLTIVTEAGDEYAQSFFRKYGDERHVYIEGGLHDHWIKSTELDEFVRRALDSTRKNYE